MEQFENMTTMDLIVMLHDCKTHPNKKDKEFVEALEEEIRKRNK